MGESAYIVGYDTPNSNLDAWMIMVNADDLIIFTSVINETMARDWTGGPQEAAGAAAGTGGYLSLPSDALESVQQAAERTGEAPAVFVARAIETQAKWDRNSLKLGINPVTGDKLDSKGGADHE